MTNRPFHGSLWGTTAIAMVAAVPATSIAQAAGHVQPFDYHHGDVLGTALDLRIVAENHEDADAAEHAMLTEIDRLTRILSAYDGSAELARLNASPVNGPGLPVSPELIDVLKQYDVWFKHTDGAYSGHAGNLLALWKQGEKDNQLPTDAALLAAANAAKVPAWEINEAARTVRRISDQQINVDSLGKGYIIDKAMQAATRAPSRLKGVMLNVGGDLRCWGEPSAEKGALWSVGVQDPSHPELNAKPLTTVFVPGNESISTSGGYQRFYTISGKRYSHIVDARTGKSARNQAATVIAPDSATANALATICCTMKYADAMDLIRSIPKTECLIITADGTQIRTDGFKEMQDRSLAADKFAPQVASQFPAGYKLSIDLEVLPTQHRPYVAAWVTDSAGKYIKTLAAYGNDPKWMRDLHEWWKFAANNRSLQNISHATQQSAKYPLMWDGTNQQGSGVPLGKYKIWVEVSAEHGPYSAKFAVIDLGTQSASETIAKSAAFAEVKLTYGPGAK